MLMITRIRRNGTVDLMIALGEENIARIQHYDPAEVMWHQLPTELRNRIPNCIAVGFCTADEQREIERLAMTDPNWKQKAFDKLSRGFVFQPEKGDHDFGPTVLGEKTEGTKQ